MSDILLVGTDGVLLSIIRLNLQRRGHQVVEESPGSFLQALMGRCPDDSLPKLVIIDVDDPALLAGLDLPKSLLSGWEHHAAVLLLSWAPGDRPAGRVEGWTFLQKPFAIPTLLDAVDSMLKKGGAGCSAGAAS